MKFLRAQTTWIEHVATHAIDETHQPVERKPIQPLVSEVGHSRLVSAEERRGLFLRPAIHSPGQQSDELFLQRGNRIRGGGHGFMMRRPLRASAIDHTRAV